MTGAKIFIALFSGIIIIVHFMIMLDISDGIRELIRITKNKK
jgi:hypothetical protein